ncbi:signal peptidase II [Candidatus Synechococcus calcipolaris G9]|uniref:Lipoprotein signal peptidase n=1 Tax=Candidatus Synechococcus calcipolaris G9 TaxID=1497997 RepID=A0ABT6EZ98_9SYNE|nr:signal peptidase II [Candidatus Synechococcus calcipolaris]MDG2990901.1 signal peptidase II [Candidatus Synechococcus calcipolaris G9]
MERPKGFKLKNPGFWWAAVVSILGDRLTKLWIVQTYSLTYPPETTPLWPNVFHITYVTNTGAAFSLFANGGGGWLRWLSLAVSLLLIAFAVFGPRLDRWEQLGYGLLLGGALGNGIDRLLKGEVVDFLDFRLIRFPIFNVADIAINLGIACLLYAAWRQHQRDSADTQG